MSKKSGSHNDDNTSMEFHCAHLGASGVSANFTGKWYSWGQIAVDSVQATMETIWEAMERVKLNFQPFTSSPNWTNPLTQVSGIDADKKYIYSPFQDKPIAQVGIDFNAMSHSDTLRGIFGECIDAGLIPARFIAFENGARMLAQFAFPKTLWSAGREHKGFCSIANALDGRWSVKAGWTLWTPVCSNTFAAGMSELSNAARHTKNMADKLPSIGKNLGIMREDMEKKLTVLDSWSILPAKSELTDAFISHLMPKKEASESRAVDNRRGELRAAIGSTAGELNRNDITIYDLFAGVSRYNLTRGSRDNVAQYEYATSGPGGKMVASAYDWLNAHV